MSQSTKGSANERPLIDREALRYTPTITIVGDGREHAMRAGKELNAAFAMSEPEKWATSPPARD